jgi:hypothetical protein
VNDKDVTYRIIHCTDREEGEKLKVGKEERE